MVNMNFVFDLSFKVYLLSSLHTRLTHMFAHASVHTYGFSFAFAPPSELDILSSLLCPQTVFTSRAKWEMEEDVGANGIILYGDGGGEAQEVSQHALLESLESWPHFCFTLTV